MTWVLIAEIVPIALLGFWGGAIAARLGTRRTMLICDLARVPLLGAIPLLHSLGLLPFPVLLALVAASGVFIAPYMGVQRAVVPGARRRGARRRRERDRVVPGREPADDLPRAARSPAS